MIPIRREYQLERGTSKTSEGEIKKISTTRIAEEGYRLSTRRGAVKPGAET
jgi:hypothetical protein